LFVELEVVEEFDVEFVTLVVVVFALEEDVFVELLVVPLPEVVALPAELLLVELVELELLTTGGA
jgi:hypothetical protein